MGKMGTNKLLGEEMYICMQMDIYTCVRIERESWVFSRERQMR